MDTLVLLEVGIETLAPTKLWCDNQVVMHIASNPVFYELTKSWACDQYLCSNLRESVIVM